LGSICASWGGTKANKGKYAEASKLLEKAIQVNPALETKGFPQLYWLAYSLASSGNYKDAYLRVNQMLLIKPDSEDGLNLKAHILSELWRVDPIYIESAITFYKERILDNNDDSFARSELYLIYNSEGFDDEARSILESSVELEKVPVQLLYRYAILLESEQKFPQAVVYLEEAVKQSQEHHIVHNLARMKKKVGDYPNAIKYYKMALDDVTESFSILRAMSDCYYFLGDFREAALTLATSILLGSNETGLWENLAFALNNLGLERQRIPEFFAYLTRSMLMEVERSRENIADRLDQLLNES
jgi:tetratricopeptide (TPR) repeat protein